MIRASRSIVILAILLAHVAYVSAQTPVGLAPVVVETQATSDFPVGIEFSAMFDVPRDDIEAIDLLARVVGFDTLYLTNVPAENIVFRDERVVARTLFAIAASPIPAGVTLDVFWRITMVSGEYVDTNATTVSWIDDRFDWAATSIDTVTVHTYALSASFTDQIVASANDTVNAMRDRYGITLDSPIDVWVYDSVADFRGTLAANTREAVAGISYPGFGVAHLVLPEGNTREIGRTVTHEVAHQVLASALGEIGTVPLWFDEGIATHAQTEGDDGYLPLAIYAATNGKLFSLGALEGSFPYIASAASIAYAVSWCAIAMIEASYGPNAVGDLIDAFATGMPVTEAIEAALGTSIADLDRQLNAWLLAQSSS